MKLSSLMTDKEAENNGVWVEIGDGGEIFVARINNPAYTARMRAITKPFKQQIQRGTLPVKRQDEFLLQVASETVLLNWKGITDDKGKEIKYSQKKALELLTDVTDFRDIVFECANSMHTFQLEIEEEDAKNSKAS